MAGVATALTVKNAQRSKTVKVLSRGYASESSGASIKARFQKSGLDVEHPIAGDELRAIKRYLASRTDALPWLFISERGQPLTRQSVNYLLAEAAARAGLPPVHPHMLRHSCGFPLECRSMCGCTFFNPALSPATEIK